MTGGWGKRFIGKDSKWPPSEIEELDKIVKCNEKRK